MKTVKEVSQITGISIRTLHHYDAIGLLRPTQLTEAGYRLYDDAALERLCMILVYRELGLPLRAIGDLLDAPDHRRDQALEHQIALMQKKQVQLQDRITLAKGMLLLGVGYMDFENFDTKKMDEYSTQAKVLYGKTEAYQEYASKARDRTNAQEQALGDQVMAFFVRLGQMRAMDPGCPEAQRWAKELQAFFTEHYYTCTPQILRCLAESYAGGGSMNGNIDNAGGPGTGAFAKAVIDRYVEGL